MKFATLPGEGRDGRLVIVSRDLTRALDAEPVAGSLLDAVEALADDWSDSRVKLDLHVEGNGERFGAPDGREMNFGFDALIAHAARTRRLRTGTAIGSGTVSNAGRAAGSPCIAERRVIEMIDAGAATTRFMRFGDRVRMAARNAAGAAPFGMIDQRVVDAGRRVPTP